MVLATGDCRHKDRETPAANAVPLTEAVTECLQRDIPFPWMQTILLGFSHDERHLVDGVQHAANLAMERYKKVIFDLLADGVVPRFFGGHPGGLKLLESILQSGGRADEVDSFHVTMLSTIARCSRCMFVILRLKRNGASRPVSARKMVSVTGQLALCRYKNVPLQSDRHRRLAPGRSLDVHHRHFTENVRTRKPRLYFPPRRLNS